MARPEETPEKRDEEIAQVAETYLQARKDGTAGTIDSYMKKYPHLGDELCKALEAINLLSTTSGDREPEVISDFRIICRHRGANGSQRASDTYALDSSTPRPPRNL